MKRITNYLSYLPSSDNPLSAEVYLMETKLNYYLFDVGNNQESYNLIQNLDKKVTIIISHFHPDHMGNLKRVNYHQLYIGKYTAKYVSNGEVLENELTINDEIKIQIIPCASSHAKGCLIVNVNDEYTLLGDAIYSTTKNNQTVYNSQLLFEMIKQLKNLKTKFFITSHDETLVAKADMISYLENIYAQRDKNAAYIQIKNE